MRRNTLLRLLAPTQPTDKIVRIFNTFGPRMHPNDGRVVSNFIVQALKNEDITIYGDGRRRAVFAMWTI